MKDKWGLDEPIYVQYYHWMTNMMTGDAGMSFQYQRPVAAVVGRALRNSMILALPSILGAFLLGSIYGALMGVNPDTWFERIEIIPPTLVGATPDFFMGILLLTAFTGWLNLFLYGGLASIEVTTTGSGWKIYLTASF